MGCPVHETGDLSQDFTRGHVLANFAGATKDAGTGRSHLALAAGAADLLGNAIVSSGGSGADGLAEMGTVGGLNDHVTVDPGHEAGAEADHERRETAEILGRHPLAHAGVDEDARRERLDQRRERAHPQRHHATGSERALERGDLRHPLGAEPGELGGAVEHGIAERHPPARGERC